MGNGHRALVERKLLELQQNQQARQAFCYFRLDPKEVAAVRKLALDTFGESKADRGACIEVFAAEPGIFRVGHFTAPHHWRDEKDQYRPRRMLFKARGHAELLEQITTWKAAGGQ